MQEDNLAKLVDCLHVLRVVYNHWTGLVDWTGGLTFFVLKITFVLSSETSLSCIGLSCDAFSLCKPGHTILSVYGLEGNNCNAIQQW